MYSAYLFLLGPVCKAVHGLLTIQAFRPDRTTSMARVFVEKVLGNTFLHTAEKELQLSSIVENEVSQLIIYVIELN